MAGKPGFDDLAHLLSLNLGERLFHLLVSLGGDDDGGGTPALTDDDEAFPKAADDFRGAPLQIGDGHLFNHLNSTWKCNFELGQ